MQQSKLSTHSAEALYSMTNEKTVHGICLQLWVLGTFGPCEHKQPKGKMQQLYLFSSWISWISCTLHKVTRENNTFPLTPFSPVGVIHLWFWGLFENPVSVVTNIRLIATFSRLEPTHIWNVMLKKRDSVITMSHCVLTCCQRDKICFTVPWSLQASIFTVTSSMAMKPSLVVFLWPANITCGWMRNTK